MSTDARVRGYIESSVVGALRDLRDLPEGRRGDPSGIYARAIRVAELAMHVPDLVEPLREQCYAACGENGNGYEQTDGFTMVRTHVDGAFRDAKPCELPAYLFEETDTTDETVLGNLPTDADASVEPGTTSWAPVNLEPIINGQWAPPIPEFLARRDGACLFYRNKINYLIGESESGKTWLALWAIVQAIQDGEHALFVDFEDDPITAIHRLRRLGASDADLANLVYMRPDEALAGQALEDFMAFLDSWTPAIVVIDSFGEGLSLWGGSVNSNDDATLFIRELPRRITRRAEACVIVIDHSRKNNQSEVKGAIGAQSKRSGLDGAALLVTSVAPFAEGLRGKATLKVDKDRPGGVRANAVGGKFAGTFILDESTRGVMNVWVDAPSDNVAPGGFSGFRPTVLMERVSNYLADHPQSSLRDIRAAVQGDDKHIGNAANVLVAEGFVTVESGPRNKQMHTLAKSYREVDDPASDKYAGHGSSGGLHVVA